MENLSWSNSVKVHISIDVENKPTRMFVFYFTINEDVEVFHSNPDLKPVKMNLSVSTTTVTETFVTF